MNAYPHLAEGLTGYLHCPDEKYIKPNVFMDLSADIWIDGGVIISDGAMLYTHEHDHSIGSGHLPVHAKSKTIRADVYIGARAIILPNCEYIAKGVVIAAGAVVTKSIPDSFENTIWGGNPAVLIKPRPPGEFSFT